MPRSNAARLQELAEVLKRAEDVLERRELSREEQPALLGVVDREYLAQFARGEERLALIEPKPQGRSVTVGKPFGAEDVVVAADVRVLARPKHVHDLRAAGERVQVCVVTCVPCDGRAVLDQANHFRMDREELLDEGPAEVQQCHLERREVVGDVALVALGQKLSDERADLTLFDGVVAALNAWLDANGGRHAGKLGEPCGVGEVVARLRPPIV